MRSTHIGIRRAGSALLGTAVLATSLLTAAPAATAGPPEQARFASFNVSMFRATEGELARDLADAYDEQQDAEVRNVAEILQRQRPDVVLLNELDHDPEGLALQRFQDRFLSQGQNGAAPIRYPYAVAFASNTGVPSGHDLNNDGVIGTSGRAGGDDSFGYGEFPGQYAFAVLSMHPVDTESIRTFQLFRWADMPGARLPDDPATAAPADWYSPEELEVLRLSSKNHVDLPVEIGGRTVHVLASHPTPPVFDGPEDRNGTRNADEIRFWADYVSAGQRSRYIYDDEGVHGGLAPGAAFVVMGDLNADPANDGDGIDGAAQQITLHPHVRDPLPTSDGARAAAAEQGGANAAHEGEPALDTADFADFPGFSGNLRVDYVLPSRPLRVLDAGVFWPLRADPLWRLSGEYDRQWSNGFPSSDHRLVWVDVVMPGGTRTRP